MTIITVALTVVSIIILYILYIKLIKPIFINNNFQEKIIKTIIDNVYEGIIITNTKGVIKSINKKAIEILKSDRQSILQKSLQDLIRLESNGNKINFNDIFNDTIETKKSKILYNIYLRCLDGETIKVLDDSLSPIIDNKGEVIGSILIIKDVTSEIQLEDKTEHLKQQVDQLSRLKVLNDYLNGIAHSFSNVLTTIVFKLEQLEKECSNNLENDFNYIYDKISDSKKIIEKLFTFSQTNKFELVPVNINRLIQNNKSTLLKVVSDTFNINIDLNSDKMVKVDLNDFDNIFLTILSIFKHNIEKNGNIKEINLKTYDDNQYVHIEISGETDYKNFSHFFYDLEEVFKRNNITFSHEYKNSILMIKLSFNL